MQRIFYHNYIVNIRPHGIASTLSCYGDGKARAIWLDEGAPAVALMPNGDIKVRSASGTVTTV
jgi:hypothetical protein